MTTLGYGDISPVTKPAMAMATSVEVSVSRRLPIHTSYQTDWVDNSGKNHIINVV